MRKGMCRQCAAFALGGQSGADVLLRIPVTKAIQPDRSFAARRQHGHIFAVWLVLHHITKPPQEHQKCVNGVGVLDHAVNISADDAADGGLTRVFRFPFGIVLSFALRRDDG